ncbi:MAG: glucose-6-phosphate isomerase [Mycoplasmoidaceae bacterium]
MINLNLKYLDKNIDTKKIYTSYKENVSKHSAMLSERKVKGSEMLGWMDYPKNISKDLIQEIENYGKKFRSKNIKNILVISIGGSYTALRAAIDMCIAPFNRDINIYYAHGISSNYLYSLKNKLEKEDFSIVVISKSGGTIEPAVSLRIFYELLIKKYGVEESKNRVVAITSESQGSLIKIAKKYNWKTFYIPEDIGGRFSAITPVGLVPMAMLGLDIKNVIKGALKARKDCSDKNIEKNTAYQYAVLRHYFYSKLRKKIEVFGSYDEDSFYFLEHLKQLYAESEGKNHKGLFPTIARFTADLHSIGQFLQEGSPIFFETLLIVKNSNKDLKFKKLFDDMDNLDYLIQKSVGELNHIACKSTMEAHLIDGGNSTIQIVVEKLNEETFGYLYYWFSKSLAMSALLLNQNPFNQPGVEAYKKRMKNNIKKK